MVRENRGLVGVVLVAAGAAVAAGQSNGSALLATFAKTLNDAQSLRANYSVRSMTGDPAAVGQEIELLLKKPNLARVETPSRVIFMDGKRVTTYSKTAKLYSRRPETDDDMRALLTDEDYSIFLGFSDPAAYQAPSAHVVGQLNVGGVNTNKVLAPSGLATTTYFLGTEDNVARAAQFEYKAPAAPAVSVIVHVSAVDLNANLPDSAFDFTAPPGAREVGLTEIDPSKWFTNLSEACMVAGASHRRVFVDLMATWCGPCRTLENGCFQTPQFKGLAKEYVFCRIDIDKQPELRRYYGASYVPLLVVAEASGKVVNKRWYGSSGEVLEFLRRNAR